MPLKAILIYSDRSLCLLCIFPCGILCLSAVTIMLIDIFLPWCAFVCNDVFVSACSTSLVKSSQFAFL